MCLSAVSTSFVPLFPSFLPEFQSCLLLSLFITYCFVFGGKEYVIEHSFVRIVRVRRGASANSTAPQPNSKGLNWSFSKPAAQPRNSPNASATTNAQPVLPSEPKLKPGYNTHTHTHTHTHSLARSLFVVVGRSGLYLSVRRDWVP